MSNLDSLADYETGVLGLTQLPVPKPNVPPIIELTGNYLQWTNGGPAELDGEVDINIFPGPSGDIVTAKNFSLPGAPDVDVTGALESFARLSTPESILGFARRYGVLEFCEHRLPATHNSRPLSIPLFGLIESTSLWKPVEIGAGRLPSFLIEDSGDRPWCEPTGVEAIEDWIYWAQFAASILNIVSALIGDLPTKREDWEIVITSKSEERSKLIDSLLSRDWIAKVYLQGAVNRWLHLANVRLSLSWPIGTSTPVLELEANTFGVLAVQLLTAVTGAQSLTVCDGCTRPYVREGRRPQRGRANYCPSCRSDGVPGRIRQQRKRAKPNQHQ